MATKTRQDLLDEIDHWKERAETAESKLDEINDIASEEDDDENEDD